MVREMVPRRFLSRLFLTLALGGCASSEAERVSSPSELIESLQGARSGDEIELTEGVYVGQFRVPAGVQLDGAGATLVGEGGKAVLTIVGAAEAATRIERLSIRNQGVGIFGSGGSLTLQDVSVEVSVGAGVVVEGMERLELQQVRLTGPVTEDSLEEIGEEVDPQLVAALGLAVSGSDVNLHDVQISGFAGFGALFRNCTGVWRDGRVVGNVGTGVFVSGGSVSLERVEIGAEWKGSAFGSTSFAYGVVVADGGRLSTTDTMIRDIDGPGLLQDAASSLHSALTVENTDMAGVWAQNSMLETPAISLMDQSRVLGCRGSGLYLRAIGAATLDGAVIRNTAKRPSAAGSRAIVVGDGVQAIGVAGRLVFRDTQLEDSARVGLLFDGQGLALEADVEIDRLSVSGSGGDYGLRIQQSSLDFRSQVRIDAGLEAKDQSASASGTVLDTSPAWQTVPSLGDVSSFSDLIGDDGQLMPWTIDGERLRMP